MNEKSESVRRQAVTDLNVVVERIDNVKKTIEDYRHENREAHQAIMKKQDYTNGKVRSLQIWKATMAGGLIILSMVAGYIISDYCSNKKAITEGEKATAVNYEIILKNSENIQRMLEQ